MNFPRIGSLLLLVTGFFAIFNIQAIAQKENYKPGDRIEYLAETYPKEVWEVGTFVHASQDGTQPIIREKPNQFNKDGFQRATQWARIRPLGAKKTPAGNDQKTDKTENGGNTVDTPTDFGRGLMSQADVLSFLQTKIGDKPFENPRREEFKKLLAEMIKARGLDFRYSETGADFQRQLAKYNAITSDVSFPLRDNYGEPTKQGWLMGSWNLGKIGAAVDYVRDNRVYRQGEIGVGNVGALTLNANGTFVWKSVTAATSTNGKWRKATKEEMRSKGGDGIVLLKAKTGYDWIVTKNRSTTVKGEWLDISELGTRQINEFGSRSGKK